MKFQGKKAIPANQHSEVIFNERHLQSLFHFTLLRAFISYRKRFKLNLLIDLALGRTLRVCLLFKRYCIFSKVHDLSADGS